MLAFCYSLPNAGDVIKGKVYENDYALYIDLFDYPHSAAILAESVQMHMDRYFKYRDKLVGKTVKVKVIRVDYTKGYIDVNYKRMCRHQ
ncbi:interferon resistance protein [Cowpox virus]|uniref:Interferon resistance protein n=1 Tax=Cowpox virus TaxID=10243 RepID=G0XWX8_COWPX|nr:interferon resistance protein [Cowpox virus]ARR31107.1 CPXV043 protein [Cowpox virus]UZC80631.1 V043; CPXV-BR_043 V043 [Cowpox virus]UZC80847.1 V043; CPXV-BR_043 V043 [Cowpox virus]UZC81064.1 V043; CPXV-BR_043 V043 [Cowpox virus]